MAPQDDKEEGNRDISPAEDDLALKSNMPDHAEGDPMGSAEPRQATFFSDDQGNLKFVNAVVRYPCCTFCSILGLCVVMTFLLIVIVSNQENVFAEVEELDINDVRSIQYDSLRLAQEDVKDARDAMMSTGSDVKRQAENGDITYWVFEGETKEGVFGTRESIAAMKEEDHTWVSLVN